MSIRQEELLLALRILDNAVGHLIGCLDEYQFRDVEDLEAAIILLELGKQIADELRCDRPK